VRFNLEDAKAPWLLATTASCLVNGREKQDQLDGWAAKPFLVIKLYPLVNIQKAMENGYRHSGVFP